MHLFCTLCMCHSPTHEFLGQRVGAFLMLSQAVYQLTLSPTMCALPLLGSCQYRCCRPFCAYQFVLLNNNISVLFQFVFILLQVMSSIFSYIEEPHLFPFLGTICSYFLCIFPPWNCALIVGNFYTY